MIFKTKLKKISLLKYGFFASLFTALLILSSLTLRIENQTKTITYFQNGMAQDTTIFQVDQVQILPRFPGGTMGWAQFMQGYIYPSSARQNNVQGTINLTFVIEKDGRLSGIRVLHDALGFGTAEEAIRLMKTSPKWSPGVRNGLPVRVMFSQPINLALN
jgi:protein TonB